MAKAKNNPNDSNLKGKTQGKKRGFAQPDTMHRSGAFEVPGLGTIYQPGWSDLASFVYLAEWEAVAVVSCLYLLRAQSVSQPACPAA